MGSAPHLMKANNALNGLLRFAGFTLLLGAAMAYIGVFVLLPLDALYHIARLLHGLGLATLVSLAAACAILGYAFHHLRYREALWATVFGSSRELLTLSLTQARQLVATPGEPDA